MANIGKSISIRGDLTGNEDMVIEGQVEGKVDLPNNQLTVGANGNLKAEIHAKGVVIVGHVSLCDIVLYVKGDERCSLLRHVAVFAPVAGSTPHEIASGTVHTTLAGLREIDGLSTG